MGNIWIMLFTMIGGICSGMQGPINSSLSKRIGTIEGALFSFGIGTLILIGLSFVLGKGSYRALVDTEPWQWVGGVLGVIFVSVNILGVPRLGATTALMCAIAGQMLIGLLIDQFGLFGITRTPISTTRVLALLLMALSIYLIKKT